MVRGDVSSDQASLGEEVRAWARQQFVVEHLFRSSQNPSSACLHKYPVFGQFSVYAGANLYGAFFLETEHGPCVTRFVQTSTDLCKQVLDWARDWGRR